jgi:hypothetical protein
MDSNGTIVVMAAIAHIHVDFSNSVAHQVTHLLHLRTKRVTIIGIARKAFRANEPSAATAYCHTNLVAKLVWLARLTLGDAFDFRFMNTVDLVLIMPLLSVNAMRRFE